MIQLQRHRTVSGCQGLRRWLCLPKDGMRDPCKGLFCVMTVVGVTYIYTCDTLAVNWMHTHGVHVQLTECQEGEWTVPCRLPGGDTALWPCSVPTGGTEGYTGSHDVVCHHCTCVSNDVSRGNSLISLWIFVSSFSFFSGNSSQACYPFSVFEQALLPVILIVLSKRVGLTCLGCRYQKRCYPPWPCSEPLIRGRLLH